jgi:hypothetical protein
VSSNDPVTRDLVERVYRLEGLESAYLSKNTRLGAVRLTLLDEILPFP